VGCGNSRLTEDMFDDGKYWWSVLYFLSTLPVKVTLLQIIIYSW
jgi:hypothetical protein